MSEDFLPLLKLNKQQIRDKVIVCGDPERAASTAEMMDQAREVSYNREYRVFNGRYRGVEITVASHGVGAPGAAVCFEELIRGGAAQIIRVGTAGSLSPEISDGELVIATGAVRKDGVTDQLVPVEYPALADYRLVTALEQTAQKQGKAAHTGIVLTEAAFYPELLELANNQYSRAGVLAVEMEASALFVIAGLHGVRSGAIMAIDGLAVDFDAGDYNPHRRLVDRAVSEEIEIALSVLTE